jgi:hypothetical protein
MCLVNGFSEMVVLNTPSTRHQKKLGRKAAAQAAKAAYLERQDAKSEKDAPNDPKKDK